MTRPVVESERIADVTARRLLERATALEVNGPTLVQLRQAAVEAGISAEAFDAAVVEWRAGGETPAPTEGHTRWTDRWLRNGAAMASSWMILGGFAVIERVADAPWLIHKLSDPVGLAIGAVIATRLRARTAALVLGGLAVSQGAEFLLDVASGAPAVQGFGAHMALIIAGIAGVAVGRAIWGRSSGPKSNAGIRETALAADESPRESTGNTHWPFANATGSCW